MLKVIVPTSILPHTNHTVRAANVVLYELLYALALKSDLQLLVLPVYYAIESHPTPEELEGITSLSQIGVRFLPSLVIPSTATSKYSRLLDLLITPDQFFYPVLKYRNQVTHLINSIRPNVVLTVWSEPLTALFSVVSLPKIAYYGNPDPKTLRARAAFAFRNGGSLLSYLRSFSLSYLFELAHLRLMSKWSMLANVAALDAYYYHRKGHPNSFYLQNVWIDRAIKTEPVTASSSFTTVRIAASVGKLDGTANTHGFEYMIKHLLPAMRSIFQNKPFELHIFGAREPNSSVASLFDAPEVVRRGFVADIDSELISCDSFLCVNNATNYNVGHTRYLHAWSLGCCVVAHVNVRKAMPELEHMSNSLLGSSPHEIAQHLLSLSLDPTLRARLAARGRDTFIRHFTSKPVADQLALRLRSLVEDPQHY